MQNVRQSREFPLFQTPSPKIPQWEALPDELRQRTVPLFSTTAAPALHKKRRRKTRGGYVR